MVVVVVSGPSQRLGKHDVLRVEEHDGWKAVAPVFMWWTVCEVSVW